MKVAVALHALAALLTFPGIHRSLGWEFTPAEGLQRALSAQKYNLVAFVAPDEEKSKALEPEWDLAVSEGTQTLISIDCSAAPETCEAHGAVSYPELVLFQDGDPLAKYLGAKRAAAILHFASRRQRPVVSHLATRDALTAFKTADETVFVAYHAPDDVQAAGVFAAVAERYRDEFSFGAVTNADLFAGEKVRETPSVVCYKVADGDTVLFAFPGSEDGGEDAVRKKLEAWVNEASRPVIGELNEWTKQRVLDRGWPIIYLFAPTEPARAKLRLALHRFARSYYDSLTAVLADPLEHPGLMARLGLAPDVFPAGAVHQLSKDRVYPYPHGGPFDANSLQKWGTDVWMGRIEPWTPPGVTTAYDDQGALRVATSKVQMRSIPGAKIRVAGHEEL